MYKYKLFWACEAIAQLHRAHKRWNSDPSAVNGYFAVPFVVAKAALVIWAVDTELSQAASISSQNHFDARFTVLSVCMSGDYSLMQVMPCHHLPALTFQNLKIENWTFGQSSVFLTTCRSSCFHLYSCKMELDWLQQVELICSFGFLIEGLSALESELRDLFLFLCLSLFQEGEVACSQDGLPWLCICCTVLLLSCYKNTEYLQ